MNDPIRWGVIGCGDVVERKSGPAFLGSERSRVRAVASSDGASAEAYAAEHDLPLATDDAHEVIDHPEVDAVYVATPPDSHEAYTAAAAAAGKPVLVEKPMGLSSVEGTRMIRACDEAGVDLFVAYYRRFHPQVRRMRALIEEGAIGTPTRAVVDYGFPTSGESGWRETPAVSGGGWFVDAASHRVDLLVSLLGAPTAVDGTVRTLDPGTDVEDAVALTLTTESGAVCTVASDFATAGSSDTFRIHGTEGHIDAAVLDDREFAYEAGDESGTLAFEMPGPTHGGLLDHAETVLLDGARNRCSGRDALGTEAVLDAVVRSTYADAIPADVWDGEGDIGSHVRVDR